MLGNDSALSLHGLTVAYDHKPVLWDVDLQVPTGVLMGVVGPNGAGKSTLLKAVLGILTPLAGSVQVFGQPHSMQRKQVGYVPQRSSVDWDFPTTVLDLVMMGTYGRLGWLRRPRAAERDAACHALKRVGMADLADRQIGELSGGQQQRAFLARAFVQDAPLLLMDEPFAGVDATTEQTLVDLMHELREQGKTLVVVHHDLTTVAEYFDQVTLLNRRVIGSGSVSTTFSAELLEQTYGGSLRQSRMVGHPAADNSEIVGGDKGRRSDDV